MKVVLETWKELPTYWRPRAQRRGRRFMGIVPGARTPASFMSYGSRGAFQGREGFRQRRGRRRGRAGDGCSRGRNFALLR